MKDIIKNLLPNFILKRVQDILKLLRKKRYINHKSTIAINYYDGIINLYKGSFTDDLLLNSGNYEENLQRVMKGLVTEGDVVIDIGANIGIHTILLSKLVGKEGRVIAFEPVPHLLKRLNTNLTLNSCRNTTVCNYAIGNENKKTSMNAVSEEDFNQGSSSLVLNENLSLGHIQIDDLEVNVRKLDDLYNELGLNKINFIKMDIEGFEYFALQGMSKIIRDHRPSLIIEYNVERLNFLNISNNDMKSLIGETYNCYEISKQDYYDETFSLLPFNFDRNIQSDLLAIPNNIYNGEI